MKKLLWIFALFVFSCLSVNAGTVSVMYNNAGVPVSVAYGYHRPISMMQVSQYGSPYYNGNRRPRPHRPRTYAGYRYNNGYAGPFVGMQESISDGYGGGTHTINVRKNISTLSKDYKKAAPTKTRTSGGVTYFF